MRYGVSTAHEGRVHGAARLLAKFRGAIVPQLRMLDKDASGRAPVVPTRHLLACFLRTPLAAADLNALFVRADAMDNGCLRYIEFLDWISVLVRRAAAWFPVSSGGDEASDTSSASR